MTPRTLTIKRRNSRSLFGAPIQLNRFSWMLSWPTDMYFHHSNLMQSGVTFLFLYAGWGCFNVHIHFFFKMGHVLFITFKEFLYKKKTSINPRGWGPVIKHLSKLFRSSKIYGITIFNFVELHATHQVKEKWEAVFTETFFYRK